VPDVLIASDEPWVREEVRAVLSGLPDTTVREVTSGAAVTPAAKEKLPDLVVADMQIGNMGGMAICLDLRLEESGGRVGHAPVLLLIDRRPDVFLARRAEAEGWLVKPLDPIRLRRAIVALLEGGTYHDKAYRPVSVP
jgi:DNA-binding NarL/FixJ family response regulator